MPEPHAFAVRNNAARLARINRSQPQDKARDRPAIPRARNAIASTATRTPRIVTTRTPLFDEAGWRVKEADLLKMKSAIFLPRNLDDPNRVEMAGEIRLCAQRVLRCFGRAVGPMHRLICPTSKSVDGCAS